jgi:hypothetical protein
LDHPRPHGHVATGGSVEDDPDLRFLGPSHAIKPIMSEYAQHGTKYK